MKEDNLIDKDDKLYINTSSKNANFSLSPEDLTNIVNKYKERDINFQDINHFKEKNGVDYLIDALKTDKKNGISAKDKKDNEEREAFYGSNKVFRKPPPNFWDFVKEAISDKMIIILICCSIFEIGVSLYNIIFVDDSDNMDWIDGTSIIIAVCVVVSVGSVTNYKKEMKFQDLNDIQSGSTKYNVIRDGVPENVISDDLLVGDLIKINYGEILPADMVMIEGNSLKIDESSLTGESTPVSKKPYIKCKEEMDKGNQTPSSMILLSGTNVIEGGGSAIIIAVGEHSQKGIIRGTIDNAQEDNKTPLELKLNDIADLIGYFGLGSAVVTLVALIIQMIYRYATYEEFEVTGLFRKILNAVILCVSIIVVAIPEGLPLAVTLSLAFSIKKLMDNQNLVRKMHACETMGGANVICTDKTGTLTLNVMYVTRLITHEEEIIINPMENMSDISLGTGKLVDVAKKRREDRKNLVQNDDYWEALYSSIALNVDCTINKLSSPDVNGDTEVCQSKNRTDKGFIEFLNQYKSPLSVKRDEFLSNPEKCKIFPFDSTKKRMTTFIKSEKFEKGYRLYTKGAAENVMEYCTKYINKESGKVEDLTEEVKKFINKKINDMNRKMMRTLYLCYKEVTEEEFNNCNVPDKDGLLPDQKDLVYIGIFGLQDTLRQGVRTSVDKCHHAGVKVIMVTGDNLITACSIAKDCNIFPNSVDLNNLRNSDVEKNPNETNEPNKKQQHLDEILQVQPYAMTGNTFFQAIGGIFCETCQKDSALCKCPKSEAELEELKKKNAVGENQEIKKDAIKNMDNFIKISTNLLVMARSQPLHKYALVLGLKALGNVVAVTGDGTNDAPALSKSDVGFSMADGTDIAKEASDIIIMDNDFSSIVIAMIYGRSIYENIRKFLQFQLTVNFGACILVFICSCVGNETPLNSIQMLWVNLIMDSLGSLALATEPPYDDLLRKKPTDRNESIINGKMWKHIGFQSIFLMSMLLLIYFVGPEFIPETKKDILESADQILNCFHELPGGLKYNNKNIIYGNLDKWSKEVYFAEMANPSKYNCEDLLPSEEAKWSNTTLYDAHALYINKYGGTTQMTMIFTLFVVYTLFNQVNCRMIDDSFNTFKRISKGIMFCFVTTGELLIQILLSQFGFKVFHCVDGGLSLAQWIMCFVLSSMAMVFSIVIKIIPLETLIDPYTKPRDKDKKVLPKPRKSIDQMISHNFIE